MAMARKKRTAVDFARVHGLVAELFGADMHAKRVHALANASLGVLAGASLGVHAIGQALAQARGVTPKHAVKQVDRLLGNGALQVWELFAAWVPYVVGDRREITVAMDWTEFDADDHSTIMTSLVTGQGRSLPLVWKSVRKSELKGQRNLTEDAVLTRLQECLPAGVKVTLLADRGFFDIAWLEALGQDWGFKYVVRFRGNILVRSAAGEQRLAREWVGAGGRARTLRRAGLTQQGYEVPTVVCMKDKAMKEPWCLAASDPQASAKDLARLYATRWSIETTFRDIKDWRFGMGMSAVHTRSPVRRDRLWLLSALAQVLLTLLGVASERTGYDRLLKVNTVKHRTHSLFRQGCMVYELIPNMPERHLRPLMKCFGEMLASQNPFRQLFVIEKESVK
jgi:hypothetical protein